MMKEYIGLLQVIQHTPRDHLHERYQHTLSKTRTIPLGMYRDVVEVAVGLQYIFLARRMIVRESRCRETSPMSDITGEGFPDTHTIKHKNDSNKAHHDIMDTAPVLVEIFVAHHVVGRALTTLFR